MRRKMSSLDSLTQRKLSESMMGIILIQNDKIQHVNEAFSRIIEYPIREILNWTLEELATKIHIDDLILKLQHIKNMQDKKDISIKKCTYNIRTKSGKIKWINLYFDSFLSSGINYELILINDITESKNIEAALKESEEKFRIIAEQSFMGIAILQNGTFKYVNNRFANIFGYSLKEMLSWPSEDYLKIIHPDDREFVRNQARKKERGNKDAMTQYQFRSIKKSGEIIWLEIYSKSIIFQGKPADMITVVDITEKNKLIQKIQESEAKYRALFENSPYAIILFDTDGNILDCNSMIETLFGYKQNELIGRNFLDIKAYPPDIAQVLQKRIEIVLKGQSTKPLELPAYRKDGKKLYVNTRASLVKLGNKTYIQAIIQDITEKKEAEEKLKESERKYRTLVENAQEGIWVIDEKDKTTFVNQRLAEILGYTVEELLGKYIFSFIDEKDLPLAKDYLAQVKKGIKEQHFFEFIRKDGRRIYTSLETGPIYDENGSYKGAIACVSDITNWKKAEQKLIESEEKYRFITEKTNYLIAILNKEFKCEFINESCIKTLGYEREELLGKNGQELVYPDDFEQVRKQFKKISEKGEGTLEVRIKKKDGTYIWLEVSGRFIMDRNEKDKIIIVAQDITERKRLEKTQLELLSKIQRQNEELKELDRIKDEFFADISHELRTPLVAIKGFAELLLKSSNLDETQREDLKIILRNEKRIEHLVNEMLEYSRLKSGKIRFKKEVFIRSKA